MGLTLGTTTKQERGSDMTDPIPELTRSEREEFWKTLGWSPELPEQDRRLIEQRWTDEAIHMAQTFGF
ncbi:hypothetical protein GCM10011588_00230 [Nocardia jinanensis]|uniref:Uncharacterized protein n=2 Tax=Nocardia jinanensis TaxID=382504 RepID=A0A917R581_9NOCA|nr:hypothetical protein GCM10011588_00230 [Nocardia jinanensis]